MISGRWFDSLQASTRLVCGLFLLAIPLIAVSASPTTQGDPRLEESRELVTEFAGQLQSALKGALQEGGVTAAIATCRDLAPQIASEISRRTGASVGRTSARYRNPLNAPEVWQAAVLDSFEEQLKASTGVVPEYFSADEEGARFMKAIPLASLCATCHGESLSPEVAQQLAADYPHDLATGYRIGDLRGAFSVFWPAH